MRILSALAGTCLATLLLLSSNLPEAKAELIVDQSQTTFDQFVNLRFSGVSGQEFTPALPSLDIVELLLDGPGGSFPPNIPADFNVRIHRGGIAGSVVGTSFSVTVLTGIFRQVVRFDFPTSVPLVPGDLYALEINRLSDPDLAIFFGLVQGDIYPGGGGIINGQSRPDLDLFFREGPRSVPEPSTLALYGLGVLNLFSCGRLRRKRIS